MNSSNCACATITCDRDERRNWRDETVISLLVDFASDDFACWNWISGFSSEINSAVIISSLFVWHYVALFTPETKG
jgi:hypothetical protein